MQVGPIIPTCLTYLTCLLSLLRGTRFFNGFGTVVPLPPRQGVGERLTWRNYYMFLFPSSFFFASSPRHLKI
ncbi:hypothetical protein F4775DRAFT_555319, partial [Biscogniauxia sp. FL1348]